jgi:hypothetical protein
VCSSFAQSGADDTVARRALTYPPDRPREASP